MSEQQPPSSGGIDWGSLREAALEAMEKAYVPYSKFPVGVAAIVTDGRIIAGCNVENISYGLTNCAERGAVFAARAAGALGSSRGGPAIVAVAVVARGATPPTPCGACRQVLNEFGPGCVVIMANLRGARRVAPLAELLPDAFGPW